MRKNLLFGAATSALLALALTGCKHETQFGDSNVDNGDIKANAELKLGVEIDPNQDWVMTETMTANITVSLGLDQKYTVGVYDANPLFESNAHYYELTTVAEGGTARLSFTAPKGVKRLFVAAFDSHLRGVAKTVNVENNRIDALLGAQKVAKAPARRAREADYTANFAKTLNDYLNPVNLLDEVRDVYNNANQGWMASALQTPKTVTLEEMQQYTAFDDDLLVNQTSNGNHTLSDRSWSASLNGAFPGNSDGKHYRVPEGVEITEVFHINSQFGVFNDAVIYIEGTVHLKGNTLNGVTLVVGNGGEIVIDDNTGMSNAGRFVVMPGGSITGTKGKKLDVNNGGPCYNAGTITTNGELNINGCLFYNNGTVSVDVLRNTSGGKITNFGSITARTNMDASDSYNCTVVNGCYMHYTQNAGIGTLTLLDNSRLDVDGRAQFNQATQTLYNLSEINAGSLYLTTTTFSGPTGEGTFAVVKAGSIQVGQGADLGAANNVYFDWSLDSIFNKQGQQDYNCLVDNGYTYLSYIKNLNLNYVNEATSPFTIPAGDCTGNGYNPGGGGGGNVGTPVIYSYAFEDTQMGDYDMNDVVLKVQETADRQNIQITLVAAGGTLDSRIYLGDELVAMTDGRSEVHDMLGVSHGTMVNTGAGPKANPVVILTVAKGNYDPAHMPLAIQASGQPRMEIGNTPGAVPFGIIIPVDWRWPTERTRITSAYNSQLAKQANATFGKFAEDVSNEAAKLWYNYEPVSGSVFIP